MKKVYPILLAIVSLATWITAGYFTYEDQQLELNHYCEMVSSFKSNPEMGWPDYKGIYLEECK